MPSKGEILGNKIMKRIHIKNLDQGGVFTEGTGTQGSGKTGVMLGFAEYALQHHKKDKVFWSEVYNSPLQIYKLEDEKIHLMVKEGSGVVFRNRDKKLKLLDLDVTYFKDFEDCYDKAVYGKINVVFFGDRFIWRDFIKHLRSIGTWIHIFIDEFGEICPSNAGGQWQEIGNFANTLKDIRKCMMNVHVNTQAIHNVDYRARNQVMIKLFLPGAMHDRHCRVTQRAIDNLKVDPVRGNSAYIVNGGVFGVVKFSKIYKPRRGRHYEAHVWLNPP